MNIQIIIQLIVQLIVQVMPRYVVKSEDMNK